MTLYIGLMSGTSMDGIDGVLVDLAPAAGRPLSVLAHQHTELPEPLREQLMQLNSPGADELHRAALASNALAVSYADTVAAVLAAASVTANRVAAVGAHGQTVRHRPGEFDGRGYTLQLLNGALLAELCGIDVVCDFRSRDVAAGGQGAPLVPAFHAALWARPSQAQAILNLGGIANLSLLGAHGEVGGFDCGPGNVLMDLWCSRHFGRAFDSGGERAAGGRIDHGLLTQLMRDPYFDLAPPKSTGRDLFNSGWLDRQLAAVNAVAVLPEDVLATLAELTVASAVQSLQRCAPTTTRLLVCGGGGLNNHLMQRLSQCLPKALVASTEIEGLPPLQVEAVAFAWLAQARLARQPGNRPEVTGAAGLRVLGALHPAA